MQFRDYPVPGARGRADQDLAEWNRRLEELRGTRRVTRGSDCANDAALIEELQAHRADPVADRDADFGHRHQHVDLGVERVERALRRHQGQPVVRCVIRQRVAELRVGVVKTDGLTARTEDDVRHQECAAVRSCRNDCRHGRRANCANQIHVDDGRRLVHGWDLGNLRGEDGGEGDERQGGELLHGRNATAGNEDSNNRGYKDTAGV